MKSLSTMEINKLGASKALMEEITAEEIRNLEQICRKEFIKPSSVPERLYQELALQLDNVKDWSLLTYSYFLSTATRTQAKKSAVNGHKYAGKLLSYLENNNNMARSLICGLLCQPLASFMDVADLDKHFEPSVMMHSTIKALENDVLDEWLIKPSSLGYKNLLGAVRYLKELFAKAEETLRMESDENFNRKYHRNKSIHLYELLKPIHEQVYGEVKISKGPKGPDGPSVRFFMYLFGRCGREIKSGALAKMVEDIRAAEKSGQ